MVKMIKTVQKEILEDMAEYLNTTIEEIKNRYPLCPYKKKDSYYTVSTNCLLNDLPVELGTEEYGDLYVEVANLIEKGDVLDMNGGVGTLVRLLNDRSGKKGYFFDVNAHLQRFARWSGLQTFMSIQSTLSRKYDYVVWLNTHHKIRTNLDDVISTAYNLLKVKGELILSKGLVENKFRSHEAFNKYMKSIGYEERSKRHTENVFVYRSVR